MVDLDRLLRESDYVSIHVPLNEETHHLIGARELSLMKSNAILSDHTGYYSEESLRELKTKTAQNVAEVLQGRRPLYPINEL